MSDMYRRMPVMWIYLYENSYIKIYNLCIKLIYGVKAQSVFYISVFIAI